jgi:hypothetical protein
LSVDLCGKGDKIMVAFVSEIDVHIRFD